GLLIPIPSQPEIQGQIVLDPPVVLEIQAQIVLFESQYRRTKSDLGKIGRIREIRIEVGIFEEAVDPKQARIRRTLLFILAAKLHHMVSTHPGSIVLQLVHVNDAALRERLVDSETQITRGIEKHLRRASGDIRLGAV